MLTWQDLRKNKDLVNNIDWDILPEKETELISERAVISDHGNDRIDNV